MRFDNQSEKLMNLLFPLYEATIKSPDVEEPRYIIREKHYKRLIKKIQKEITDAHTAVEKIKKSTLYSQKLELITSKSKGDMPKPSFFNSSHFLPDSIKQYVLEHANKYLLYNCKMNGRQFNIYFTLFDNDENYSKYDNYATLVFIWLYIASNHSKKKCAKTLDVFFYLTPFQKRLPLDKWRVIDTEHVNTAVTTSCAKNGEILLFRREEWFKVFIHETFHIFGLDFSDMLFDKLSEKIKEIFPIKSNMLVHETYTEMWATILNCAFYSYNLLENKKDSNQFYMYMEFCIEFERLFSTLQIIKILNFMGLSYVDLYSKSESSQLARNLYKEKTNVFPYYILKFITLNFHRDFVIWCDENNTTLYNFEDSNRNLMLFFNFIQDKYDHVKIQKTIYNVYHFANSLQKKHINQKEKQFLFNNMRMTICDFI